MLFNAFISKNQFHYESGEVQEILARMTQSLNNTAAQGSGDSVGGIMADKEIKFNKTRLKSLSEMACFQKEFKVKQILPMVEIDGLLYITNTRLYFQPYHNLYDKQVINFKIENFLEFFCRRFKLLEVGMQLKLNKRDQNGQRREETLFLTFESQEERDAVYNKMLEYCPRTCKTESTDISVYTYQWVNG